VCQTCCAWILIFDPQKLMFARIFLNHFHGKSIIYMVEYNMMKFIFLRYVLDDYILKMFFFISRFDLTLDEHRQITLERAKYIFGLPEIQQQFKDQVRVILEYHC
jgi:hypothetical protein